MRKPMKYESKWYVNECANRKRMNARPYRSSAKPFTHETNEKAADYARWLAARDGVYLEPSTVARVVYDACAAGSRPKAVSFYVVDTRPWHHPARKPDILAATINLPNWDFVAAEPVETVLA